MSNSSSLDLLFDVGGAIIRSIFDSDSSSSTYDSYSSSDYDSDYSLHRSSSSRRITRNYVRGCQVAATTSTYLSRYKVTLNDMRAQGLDKYVRSDFEELSSILEQAQGMLDDSPFQARDISQQIGARIGGLPRLARELRRGVSASEEAERREGQRLEREMQHKEAEAYQVAMLTDGKEAMAHIAQAVQNAFTDPVEQDIVRKELKTLRKNFESQVVGVSNIKELKSTFDQELAKLQKTAREKATAWREKKRQEQSADAVEDTIANAEAVIQKHSKPEISAELESLNQSLGRLKEDFRAGIFTAEQVTQKVFETQNAATEAMTTEALRRETLKALAATTTKLGFVMNGKPKLLDDGNVRINLRRPGGEECTFLINAKGGMRYSFDNYKGMACKNDIDVVKKQLNDVYGVHFSHERVIWQNPDEIGKTAVDNPDSIKKGR